MSVEDPPFANPVTYYTVGTWGNIVIKADLYFADCFTEN